MEELTRGPAEEIGPVRVRKRGRNQEIAPPIPIDVLNSRHRAAEVGRLSGVRGLQRAGEARPWLR